MFDVNDIVQIIDTTHPWFPSLLVVDEVKSWGVQAYCLIPKSNTEGPAEQAYNRLKNEQVVKVGRAEVFAE